jgi:hypothetical protein
MKCLVTEEVVHATIEVILSDKKSYNKSLNYAIAYCRAAQKLSGYALYVQCLYVLSNIQYWRHPEAKKTREVLKSFIKEREV